MREPIAAFTKSLDRLLAAAMPGSKARLIRIETRPWQSATFDGWAFEFTLEALLPPRDAAIAPMVCADLSDTLHDADLPLPGHVVIEMNAVQAAVEAQPDGAARCRVSFAALTVLD